MPTQGLFFLGCWKFRMSVIADVLVCIVYVSVCIHTRHHDFPPILQLWVYIFKWVFFGVYMGHLNVYHTHLQTHKYTPKHTHTHTHIHTQTHTHIWINTHTHTRVCVCIHRYMYVYIHVYSYTNICIYTYPCTFNHT